MFLIESSLVIWSFQVSTNKNRKLPPHMLRSWEEEVKNATPRQQAQKKDPGKSHLIHREGGKKRGAQVRLTAPVGISPTARAPSPRANAPIQAARHPLSPVLPVSGRAGCEIRKVALRQCSYNGWVNASVSTPPPDLIVS